MICACPYKSSHLGDKTIKHFNLPEPEHALKLIIED